MPSTKLKSAKKLQPPSIFRVLVECVHSKPCLTERSVDIPLKIQTCQVGPSKEQALGQASGFASGFVSGFASGFASG